MHCYAHGPSCLVLHQLLLLCCCLNGFAALGEGQGCCPRCNQSLHPQTLCRYRCPCLWGLVRVLQFACAVTSKRMRLSVRDSGASHLESNQTTDWNGVGMLGGPSNPSAPCHSHSPRNPITPRLAALGPQDVAPCCMRVPHVCISFVQALAALHRGAFSSCCVVTGCWWVNTVRVLPGWYSEYSAPAAPVLLPYCNLELQGGGVSAEYHPAPATGVPKEYCPLGPPSDSQARCWLAAHAVWRVPSGLVPSAANPVALAGRPASR